MSDPESPTPLPTAGEPGTWIGAGSGAERTEPDVHERPAALAATPAIDQRPPVGRPVRELLAQEFELAPE